MDFKILTINGKDLSGASHDDASRAFECAEEPITVVLRRNEASATDSTRTSQEKPMLESPTEECFCQYLLENCSGVSHPFSSYIMSEYVRYQRNRNLQFNEAICTDSCNDERFSYENEVFHIAQQEITLNRSSGNEKLGITLYDEVDPYTNQNKVVVTHVAPNTVAAKSQKIFEGDQILEIDEQPVNSTADACQMLKTGSSVVKFLIGRPQLLADGLHENSEQLHFHGDDVLRDVTNYSYTSRGLSPLNELSQENTCTEYREILSEQISCNSSMTAESNLSKHTGGSQSAKDSGICHTLESRLEDSLQNEARGSVEVDFHCSARRCISSNNVAHTKAGEFTYVSPQEYHCKPQERVSKCSTPSKNSTETALTNNESDQVSNLRSAIENFGLTEQKNEKSEFTRTRLSSIDEIDDNLSEICSPWVHIAHQEYVEKMRQLQLSNDVRNIHPAMMPISTGKLDLALSASNPSDTNDNTSSAYNTGESFKSSTSENSRLNEKTSTTTATGNNPKHKNLSHHYVTMTYSSDANSDGEGPACYLTHNEGSDSEGFEDAGIEFRSVFNSKTNDPNPNRPVPLPRILHPPREATSFLAHSLTASTSNLWKATAAAARSRRQHVLTSNLKTNQAPKSSTQKHVNWKFSEDKEQQKFSNNETSATDTNNVPLNKKPCFSSQQNPSNNAKPKVRPSSDHIRPNMRHLRVKRSMSCADSQYASEDNKDVQMEWKVRVKRDGTRYITKRPVRERLLREREKRLLAERCMTTDDDFTELKFGHHCSRGDRKRQLRIARDKKRRRELMHQCRMEALNETTPADGEIIELSQKRMSKQKHKRMLLDNFVTVQELLAHGDRSADIAEMNPLLSVTYI